jgi:hypothetical protein
MTTPRDSVRERATGAVLRNALFSWQTGITLIVTALLFFAVPAPFEFWQPWFWLVLGGIAEAAFIAATLTDPEQAQRAVAQEFESQFDINQIRSTVARQRVASALEYRRNMQTLLRRSSGAMRISLQNTVDDVTDWITQMQHLALQIDAFEANELVERDRRQVPQQLEKARQRLNLERDEGVRRDLEEQVERLEIQLSNLNATANNVKRAEIQLDNTLSALGTIYAQMAMLGTKDIDSGRAQRLRLEIRNEVESLQDTIHAMDEVQAARLRLE